MFISHVTECDHSDKLSTNSAALAISTGEPCPANISNYIRFLISGVFILLTYISQISQLLHDGH